MMPILALLPTLFNYEKTRLRTLLCRCARDVAIAMPEMIVTFDF